MWSGFIVIFFFIYFFFFHYRQTHWRTKHMCNPPEVKPPPFLVLLGCVLIHKREGELGERERERNGERAREREENKTDCPQEKDRSPPQTPLDLDSSVFAVPLPSPSLRSWVSRHTTLPRSPLSSIDLFHQCVIVWWQIFNTLAQYWSQHWVKRELRVHLSSSRVMLRFALACCASCISKDKYIITT